MRKFLEITVMLTILNVRDYAIGAMMSPKGLAKFTDQLSAYAKYYDRFMRIASSCRDQKRW